MKQRHRLYVYPLVVLLPVLLLLCLSAVETGACAPDLSSFGVSRNVLSFAGEDGGPDPRAQRFGITNTGSGPIHWSVSADGSAPWLDIVPTSGLDDGAVRVSVDTTALVSGTVTLTPGTFTETLTVSALETTATEVVTVTLVVTSTVTPLYSEDFQAYASGADPVDWLDTGAGNSLEEEDLFEVLNLGGGRVFGTTSTAANIHSHYVGAGSAAFSSYEYSGRMRMTSSGSGIGVTFLSQYPQADAYYRLRRHGSSGSFHLSRHPEGTSITAGTTDTGVVPDPNDWYLFRIRVEDTGIRTEIRAKVWEEGESEPADWQVDCYDANPTRLAAGTVGVWSYSSGNKYWDDLEVNPLPPEPDESPPFAYGHDPAPGATDVDPSSDIVVHVADSSAGVDSATLAMTVGGVPVSPAVTGSLLDYTLTYDPPTDFDAGEVVTVTVDGCDLAVPANCMDTEVYSFTVQTLPVIDVWYGSPQVFGHIGIPQQWVNILGNVSDPDGVASLAYSLNGGPETSLSIGPDTYRLAAEGDFNVDMAHTDLISGSNQVVITAIDTLDNTTAETVTVEYVSGNVWPETYSIDWSSAASIQDVAQVVDGLWTLEADSIRPAELGYDRLVAIGDVSWDDYEVTVPITINGTDPLSSGPGVGILMRWTGHTDDPISDWQPKSGYLPLGALGMYRWKNDALGDRLQLMGNGAIIVAEDTSGRKLEYDVPYIFKMHVETMPGRGGLYSLKVWEDGQPEPSAWDLYAQEELSDPQNGSFLLFAHHVDASFGDVTVTPGPFDDTIPPVISNIQITPGETSAMVTWSTNEPATSTVAYGPSAAYENGTVDDSALVTEHTITLTGLSSGLLYHCQITSADDSGNAASSTDLTFRTTGVPSSIVSDDFNTCDLNTGLWTFIDPVGDATRAMTGTHTEDAWVSISVPAGVSHDVSTPNLAPRIMQPANDANLEIEVKFESELSQQYQMQGVLIEEEQDSDYLRFDFYSDGSNTYIFANSFVGGTPTSPPIIGRIITNTNVAPLYMRVRREADLWTLSYSYDGENWTTDGDLSFDHHLTVTSAGAFVGNAGSDPPAHTGSIDYFFNNAFPIVPEDDDRNTLTVNPDPVGVGSVITEPAKSTYNCGEVVTLTATAYPGWTFAGWSGDLYGTTTPVTVTMTGSRLITATFTQDEYTLTVNTIGNGSVTKDPDRPTYTYGQVVTLTAEPAPGWSFAGWSGDPDSGITTTVTITGNTTVTATFTAHQIFLPFVTRQYSH
jgi:uncharacterized repeat protein (TIGR02543 family)